MYKYIIIHEFKNGQEFYKFSTPILLSDLPFYNEEDQMIALANIMGINFEPDKGEFLTINLEQDHDYIHIDEDTLRKICST